MEIHRIQAKLINHLHDVLQEAVALLRRRKFSYAACALALAAGSVYIGGMQSAANPGPISPNADGQSGNLVRGKQVLQPVVPDQITALPHQDPAPEPPAQPAQSHTSVTVNGRDIPVPDNGAVHTTVTDNGSTTSISVSHDSSGDNTYSSLHVDVSSQSQAGQEDN